MQLFHAEVFLLLLLQHTLQNEMSTNNVRSIRDEVSKYIYQNFRPYHSFYIASRLGGNIS